MQVHVADHPLISHKLSLLRDESTSSPLFRALTSELVTLLAYEATRHIRIEDHQITTPVTTTMGKKLASHGPWWSPSSARGWECWRA
jgi:uracil phosphoribosyltransferase